MGDFSGSCGKGGGGGVKFQTRCRKGCLGRYEEVSRV